MKHLEHRTYQQSKCAGFSKSKDKYGGLSNMCGGYPLHINGQSIRSLEALYQALKFPHNPEIQTLIFNEKSPITAKRVAYEYLDKVRSDWKQITISVMRWCLKVKLAQNWNKFSAEILSTNDLPIVEISYKDQFWGATPQPDGTIVGTNALGRLLMELRELLIYPTNHEYLKIIHEPMFPNAIVMGKQITGDDYTSEKY